MNLGLIVAYVGLGLPALVAMILLGDLLLRRAVSRKRQSQH